MHICVAYLTIIASDNGLSPSRRQAIIWTNAGILLIRPVGTNFSEILNKIHKFPFKKMQLKTCLRNGSHFVSASMCERRGLVRESRSQGRSGWSWGEHGRCYECSRYPMGYFYHVDGLVQDCSNSSALVVELLQSCIKPSMYLKKR